MVRVDVFRSYAIGAAWRHRAGRLAEVDGPARLAAAFHVAA
jgi:hypothetical protein